jgi:hypothetical protein
MIRVLHLGGHGALKLTYPGPVNRLVQLQVAPGQSSRADLFTLLHLSNGLPSNT